MYTLMGLIKIIFFRVYIKTQKISYYLHLTLNNIFQFEQ